MRTLNLVFAFIIGLFVGTICQVVVKADDGHAVSVDISPSKRMIVSGEPVVLHITLRNTSEQAVSIACGQYFVEAFAIEIHNAADSNLVGKTDIQILEGF